MMDWSKISLFKFQQIQQINANENISDLDKVLFSTCVVFDMTEFQLDNAGIKKAQALVNRTNKIFSSPLAAVPCKRIGGYQINYDPATLTFGQYIDLSFFLQSHIKNAHYCLASVSRKLFRRYNSDAHRSRSEFFLRQPVNKVVGSLSFFMERFKDFNHEYRGLFGLDKEVSGNDAPSDAFNKRYGWIYSASQVAEYERISLEQALGLPIRQALNALGFLKARAKYESEQQKKMAAEIKTNRNVR